MSLNNYNSALRVVGHVTSLRGKKENSIFCSDPYLRFRVSGFGALMLQASRPPAPHEGCFELGSLVASGSSHCYGRRLVEVSPETEP